MAKPSFAALALCAALSGCANMTWEKPGVDAVASGRDLAECQRIAQLDASRMALASPIPAAPTIITSPSGAASIQTTPLPLSTQDPTLAQQYTMDCMRKKGYALVKGR
jgi:hypothetical protein